MPFTPIEKILEELRRGRMIVLVDDEDRENEGDLIIPAERCTAEEMNFMIKFGRGVPFIAATAQRLEQLNIPLMTKRNTSRHGTAMAETVDAVRGTTTGVSAFDRAATAAVFVDDAARPDDLARPGHVIPLRASEGGVLVRAGHTEAIVDLCKLAGFKPAGVGCEVIGEDGKMMRRPQLELFCREHDLKIGSIADLIAYRLRSEQLVRRIESVTLPTRWGEFKVHAFLSDVDKQPHLALCKGGVADLDEHGKPIVHNEPVLVRVHSECLTGDVFGSGKCDCGDQLDMAMRMIESEGKGAFIYLRQEGRGIGLANKLHAYALQEKGLDTVEANERLGLPADKRDYGIGCQILRDLGLRKIRIMTNNPKKIRGIDGFDLSIVEQIPIQIPPGEHNRRYLQTKKEKLGHTL